MRLQEGRESKERKSKGEGDRSGAEGRGVLTPQAAPPLPAATEP